MIVQQLYHTYKRYRTLQTHTITTLPIVILMPHSACNCRCVMCDIWKDNKNLKQLTAGDITDLLTALHTFDTRLVVLSGGEALLNPNFFILCEILKKAGLKITLLTTGLSLKRYADRLMETVDDIIVSLDGPEAIHDAIRNIPGAFQKLREGVEYIKAVNPRYRVTARSVIHRLNFRHWAALIDSARNMGLDQVSFLPADVSSHAFNRQQVWDTGRQHEVLLQQEELAHLYTIIEQLITGYKDLFDQHFVAESPQKIQKIYAYYAAYYGLNPFPFKKCNAPWVSTVIEADGTVRPCFFHEAIGNIREHDLETILNSREAIRFRKQLNMDTDSTCIKCVCSLNLSPRATV
jgi:Fe-coproporphyrin III synthase